MNLVYSSGNRSACIRVPITGTNAKAKRIEFRIPDPSCNPYLAFSAMLMAGVDGIRNKIEPPTPVDKDLYELPPDEAAAIAQVPGLARARCSTALEADHEYLHGGWRLHRRTSSTRGSRTSGPTRSTRFGCARTRTSSSSTTTSERS